MQRIGPQRSLQEGENGGGAGERSRLQTHGPTLSTTGSGEACLSHGRNSHVSC